MKIELPFVLQDTIEDGRKLIDHIEVLSIDEWNADSNYGNYPIKQVSE